MIKDLVLSEDWSPQVGGAHFWLENTYRRWGAPVEVMTAKNYSKNARLNEAIFKDEVGETLHVRRILEPLPNISLRPFDWVKVYRNVRFVCRSIGKTATRIHCKAYFPEGMIGLLTKYSGKQVPRLIVYAHGEEVNVARSSRLLTAIARHVYASADLIIANSRNTERMVRSLVPNVKTVIIHPGVDVASVESVCEKRNIIRCRQGWPDKLFVILTIARLEPQKNVARVIEALKMLRDEGAEIRYVVIGSGSELSKLKQKVLEIDARQWIEFYDRVSEQEKLEFLASSDIYAMPSIKDGQMIEGFGIAFIEAAAARLPSISGIEGGQAEAVLDGLTGFNVDGESVEAIKDRISFLINNNLRYEEMADRASEWARINDWSEVARKTRIAIECGES
jgi:phosphatidylinositol alpha-1,6-mannosyltransferase